MKQTLLLLPGDGIGPEVIAEARRVAGKVAPDIEIEDGLVGGAAIDAFGVPLSDETLARAKASGFHVLVVTVDVPVASRRERQVKGGLVQPPRITPRIALQCAMRPAWSLARLRAGMPRISGPARPRAAPAEVSPR